MTGFAVSALALLLFGIIAWIVYKRGGNEENW